MSMFRKVSLEKISSPEQMDDVIRVTTPAVWIALFVLIATLVAILVWCIFGTVEMHDEKGNPTQIHPITYVTN